MKERSIIAAPFLVMAKIAAMMAIADEVVFASFESWNICERAALIDHSLIRLRFQEMERCQCCTEGYYRQRPSVCQSEVRDINSRYIPVIILAVPKHPLRFTDRSGSVSRRLSILCLL